MKIYSISILTTTLLLAALTVSLIYLLRSPKHGNVVIILGTSSSGKTTLINELQKKYAQSYKVIAIDTFLPSYIKTHPFPEGPEFEKLDQQAKNDLESKWFQNMRNQFYNFIKKESLKGKNIWVDTVVSIDDDKQLDKMSKALQSIKPIKILLYCPLETVLTYIAKRNATNDPDEQRSSISHLIPQYQAMYKPQTSMSETIVEVVDSKQLKKVIKNEINIALQNLPDTQKANATKFTENLEQKFIEDFKLDILSKVSIVPKNTYDLILNCKNSPTALAKEIEDFISSKK